MRNIFYFVINNKRIDDEIFNKIIGNNTAVCAILCSVI